MNRFARLLEALALTPGRTGKLRHLQAFFASTPDPERGYALAALTDALTFRAAKPAMLRALVTTRVDPILFALSYDYVGDLAETAALIWQHADPKAEETQSAPLGHSATTCSEAPSLTQVVETLQSAGRSEVPALLAGWLDRLNAEGRYALLKLLTGALRVGVSARLAKTALAGWSGQPLETLEELWHGLTPPYPELFAWLEGRGPKPEGLQALGFRPFMLANPLDDTELDKLDPSQFHAEWKWDGIRVQLAAAAGETRLYSRGGEEIGDAFLDLLAGVQFDAVLDGELLVLRHGTVAPFSDLQQRLNRKTVTAKLQADYPVFLRLYDLLAEDEQDLRPLPFQERRRRLAAWFDRHRPERMDLSPLVPFDHWETLRDLRAGARAQGIEGLMLKRTDSSYVPGRPMGLWFKWKRAALTVDTVLMYAQRGHGKRSSFYSDYTFGVWRDDALVPVGKAYSGFTDAELTRLDRWVRAHTRQSFGPVREVAPELVLEVAFDSVHLSKRHKSGLAMRFPRIHRIRWDKPAQEADRLASLERLVDR